MDCMIAMRSQTYAAKGIRLLGRHGIHGTIVGIDPSLTRHGCAFGIRIPEMDCGRAKSIFDKQGFAYGDILGGGTWQND